MNIHWIDVDWLYWQQWEVAWEMIGILLNPNNAKITVQTVHCTATVQLYTTVQVYTGQMFTVSAETPK